MATLFRWGGRATIFWHEISSRYCTPINYWNWLRFYQVIHNYKREGGAFLRYSLYSRNKNNWLECRQLVERDSWCCGRPWCDRQNKINWTKVAHHTQVPIQTLFCGYVLSSGPTEGLSSWWPSSQSYLPCPKANNINNTTRLWKCLKRKKKQIPTTWQLK